MNILKCPHCGFKLGDHLYADACPQCRHGLEHNARSLTSAPARARHKDKIWPIRLFLAAVRFVES